MRTSGVEFCANDDAIFLSHESKRIGLPTLEVLKPNRVSDVEEVVTIQSDVDIIQSSSKPFDQPSKSNHIIPRPWDTQFPIMKDLLLCSIHHLTE
jgi:hypothetical protein